MKRWSTMIGRVRVSYNAPFVLTFALVAVGVLIIDTLTAGVLREHFFSIQPALGWSDPLTYPRLVFHVLGHADFAHLFTNLTVILLIGPMLEEKYHAPVLVILAALTAVLTGIVAMLLDFGLMGASGVAFMLIVLGSFANVSSGRLPLTFVFVVILFLGNEIVAAFQDDRVAQFTHLLGGLVGGLYGWVHAKRRGQDPVAS